MRIRLSLHKDGKSVPGADILPAFMNLEADYERGLALVDVPDGTMPAWIADYAHPQNAPIDQGMVKHLTLAQREELKRWMSDSYPTRPEFETVDLG